MKKYYFAYMASCSFLIAACNNMGGDNYKGADFDPLSPPGNKHNITTASSSVFAAGKFVVTSIDNTAFFKKMPTDNSEADKTLSRGVSMKVISSKQDFTKVELDSGEIGFVPTIMLQDKQAAATTTSTTTDNSANDIPPSSPLPDELDPSSGTTTTSDKPEKITTKAPNLDTTTPSKPASKTIKTTTPTTPTKTTPTKTTPTTPTKTTPTTAPKVPSSSSPLPSSVEEVE